MSVVPAAQGVNRSILSATRMEMDVEIELRVPSFVIKKEDGKDGRIDNQNVRFRKVIQVPEFPKPGSKIRLTAGQDLAFECVVIRADWHEVKQRFVLACKYPNTRILAHEYEALIEDPDWERTEFLV